MNLETESHIKSNSITIPLLSNVQQSLPSQFTHRELFQDHIADICLAASRITGSQRRAFMAEMSLKYCNGSARLTERVFGWSRDAVLTGLSEKRTGIVCIGMQSSCCGNIRWEEKHPEIAKYLCEIAEKHSQQDPTFQTTIAFTRLTAQSALNALREAGFSDEDLPASSYIA